MKKIIGGIIIVSIGLFSLCHCSESTDHPKGPVIHANVQTVIETRSQADSLRAEAHVLEDSGMYEEAIRVHELILALEDSLGTELTLSTFNSRFAIAELYIKLGRYVQSIEQYKAVIERDTARVFRVDWAHLKMGELYEHIGKDQDAINAYSALFEKAPYWIFALEKQFRVGEIYEKVGQVEKAIESYDKIIKRLRRFADRGFPGADRWIVEAAKRSIFKKAKGRLERLGVKN